MKITKYFLLILVFFLTYIYSCLDPKCRGIKDISVSPFLLRSVDKKVNYCSLVRKSLKLEEKALKEISLLSVHDGNGYEHGAVIIDIIESIGEDNYLALIKPLTSVEKDILETNIILGLHMPEHKNNFRTYDVSIVFPKLYEYLNEN